MWQIATNSSLSSGLLVQVLLPPLLCLLSRMEDEQQTHGLRAQVARAVRLVRLEHQAVSRLEPVRVVGNAVLDPALQAKHEFLP